MSHHAPTPPTARHASAGSVAPGPAPSDPVAPDPWAAWRQHTPARIALGRSGVSLPTAELLRFGAAHAAARDAIHTALDVPALQAELHAQGWATAVVASRAGADDASRQTYLRRPDLGRQLDPACAQRLAALASGPLDMVFVLGDGLSARAVQSHAAPLLAALRPLLGPPLRLGPVVLASQARVALGDAIGAALQARLVAVLIGERPGLSSPDSLGIYLTHAPRIGRSDAERNCISNIRAQGLSYQDAAARLAWLAEAALRRGLTGVLLKDESAPTAPGLTS